MSTTAAPVRAWQLVLEQVESDLLEGALAPGDHLPSERDLASALGVGRSSVREALRVLEVLGLIRTATGSGPTSGAIVVAAPQGGMAALLRLQVAAKGFPIDDVVRTRVILESAVAESLARAAADGPRPSRDVLDGAQRVHQAMDAAGLAPAEFLALDAQFHLALAEASGNTVVSATMSGLRTAIESYVLAGAARVHDWEQAAQRLRAEHGAILDAVRAGDPDRARTLITDHITGYYARTGLTRD